MIYLRNFTNQYFNSAVFVDTKAWFNLLEELAVYFNLTPHYAKHYFRAFDIGVRNLKPWPNECNIIQHC